ncbi:MAG: multidrug effflux MFS transporter [Alphaproteobacteria bacterium]
MALPLRPSLAILVATTATGPLALNIFHPSMPGLVAVFDTSYAMVQLTLTLYLLAMAFSQLVYGPLADRYGRRITMLWGLGLYVAGSIMATVAPTLPLLLAGRVVQAAGGIAGMVIARAMVRDLYDRERSAGVIAYITMAMVVAPMLAPTIGGFLDVHLGWRSSFAFVAIFGGVVMAFAVFNLPETLKEAAALPNMAEMVRGYGRLMREPAFVGYAFQAAFSTAIFFSFITASPFIIINLMGLPPSAFGLLFVMVSGGFMAGNFAATRASRRIGSHRTIAIGIGFAVVGIAIMAALALGGVFTSLALFGPMMAVAFGNGLSLPNAMAGIVSVNPRLAGTASGLGGFIQMGLGSGATFLVGSLQGTTQMPVIAVMTVGVVFSALSYWLATWGNRRPAPHGQGA